MALLDLTRATTGVLLALTAGLVGAGAEARAINEYQVKAAFLLNFAKFVVWPPTAFSGPDTPFEICVLGANPFGSLLEETVRGIEVAGRSFVVRNVSGASQSVGCHILFFGASERRQSRFLLNALRDLSVLTVGETDDFLAKGGIIRFRLKDSQLHFEIDAEAAARRKLKISSKLLSLGDARNKEKYTQ